MVEYAMRYLGFFLFSKLHSSLKAEHSSVSPSRSYGLAKLLNFCRLIRKKILEFVCYFSSVEKILVVRNRNVKVSNVKEC